jgi:hypothetical protein
MEFIEELKGIEQLNNLTFDEIKFFYVKIYSTPRIFDAVINGYENVFMELKKTYTTPKKIYDNIELSRQKNE